MSFPRKVAGATLVLVFVLLLLASADDSRLAAASIDCNARDAFTVVIVNGDLSEPEKLNRHGS